MASGGTKMKKILTLLIVSILLTACSKVDDTNFEKKIVYAESTALSHEDKLALIGKGHYDLYATENHKALPIMLAASLLDDEVDSIIEEIGLDNEFNESNIEEIVDWSANRIIHTQITGLFEDTRSKDPWGSLQGNFRIKNLLPSEMAAMSIYTSKYTGKCESIAHLLYCIVDRLGIEDKIIFWYKGHTVGLFRLSDKLYATDNNYIVEIDNKVLNALVEYQYQGFHTDEVSYLGAISIDEDILEYEGNLLDYFMSKNALSFDDLYHNENDEDVYYALQSMDIYDNELLLEASLIAPLASELADDMESIEDIIFWISENIGEDHGLSYPNTVQIADQTIVFKCGNHIDKGMLALTLARHNVIDSKLIVCEDDSYLLSDDMYYSMSELDIVDKLPEAILYEF